jgi:hypothetical protein
MTQNYQRGEHPLGEVYLDVDGRPCYDALVDKATMKKLLEGPTWRPDAAPGW